LPTSVARLDGWRVCAMIKANPATQAVLVMQISDFVTPTTRCVPRAAPTAA
jgi:hypothetical protein